MSTYSIINTVESERTGSQNIIILILSLGRSPLEQVRADIPVGLYLD